MEGKGRLETCLDYREGRGKWPCGGLDVDGGELTRGFFLCVFPFLD